MHLQNGVAMLQRILIKLYSIFRIVLTNLPRCDEAFGFCISNHAIANPACQATMIRTQQKFEARISKEIILLQK
jgi:hypothetical protein